MRNNCTHYKNCKTKSALELMTPDCDLTMTTTNLFLWPHEQSLAVKKRKSRKQIRLKKGFSLIVLILVTCVSTIGVLRSLVIISFLREDGRLKNLGGGDEKIKRLLKENVLFLVLQKSGGWAFAPPTPSSTGPVPITTALCGRVFLSFRELSVHPLCYTITSLKIINFIYILPQL